MNALAWFSILGAPLLAWCGLRIGGTERVGAWCWLACVPALVACWLPPAGLSLPALWPGAELGLDDNARYWLGFSALLWAFASGYAAFDLKNDDRSLRFWTFWLIAMGGNFLLLVAQDVATFYVGFSMMSLAGYGLIVHLGGPAPRQAGRIYLQLAILGELLLFSGIMLRVHQGDGMMALSGLQDVAITPLAAILLLVGLGLKAGFWPLHVWLPLAHPAAPAGASAVLSGAMIKAGIYGLWRLLPGAEPLLQQWAPVLLTLAFVSMFFGVLMGVVQAKPKTVLAYSSVSQMGYLLAILALAWLHPDGRGAMGILLSLFALHHGLAKGALFMGAGLASHYRLSWLHWLLMVLPALALAGLPMTSGSAVKLLLKESLEDSFGPLLVFTLSLASTGTGLLMLRTFWLMRQARPHTAAFPAAGQWLPWALLCCAAIIVPWAVVDLRQHSLYGLTGAAWSLFWPALLAVAIGYLAHRSRLQTARLRQRLPAPARRLSLSIKRLTQPRLGPPPITSAPRWRLAERVLNRFAAREAVGMTGWLLLTMLLVGWVMAL
ncbi:complex I subunit 5 family protein [Pseudomonas sp.]|uniref:complex I subunit 5 family protein n=1 Tax=Pseudomonas sp. TaxID=306 RepID=UPI00272AD894|nr:complex I subunit 5 family protein [Pseudomonas sp.]